ncbi:MAG: hypothetical protein Tsb0014_06300 [Pleurocapsa sp.]
MTFVEDLTVDKDLESDYPSAFGITFTPMVSGIALAVVGIVGAGYIFMNMVLPAREQYKQATTKKQEVETQLNQIKTGDLQLKLNQLQSELEYQKLLKSRVIAMFTSEKDLDTLLIDLNNFITANQGKLLQYQPDSKASPVQDGSLGAEVNGKLNRKGISITIEGTYNQTKSILQDIERLQPLLMVKNISFQVSEKPTAILTSSQNELVSGQEAKLKTDIKLDAILPSSQEELEAAKKAEEQAQQEEENRRQSKRRNRKNRKETEPEE